MNGGVCGRCGEPLLGTVHRHDERGRFRVCSAPGCAAMEFETPEEARARLLRDLAAAERRVDIALARLDAIGAEVRALARLDAIGAEVRALVARRGPEAAGPAAVARATAQDEEGS